jgi:serine/threonine protein kinase
MAGLTQKSLSNTHDDELIIFLKDILTRTEISTSILDFTEAELKRTAAAIKELHLVHVKTRYYHLRSYKSCFIGKDFVDGLCDDKLQTSGKRETATLLGNYLLRGGLLHHVCDDHHVFKDDYLFYRFYSDDIKEAIRRSSIALVTGFGRKGSSSGSTKNVSVDKVGEDENFELPDMFQLAQLARKHLPISDRRYHLKIYHNTFTGTELVDVFVNNGIADTRSHAALLGRALWTAGVIHHVHDDHQFSDRGFFYRFYQDEDYFTFMDSISWLHERRPGFPQNKWTPIKDLESVKWRVLPHTVHNSVLFNSNILDDIYLCDNYNEKHKESVRKRVSDLLFDTFGDYENSDRVKNSEFQWERIRKDGHKRNHRDNDSASSHVLIYRLVGEMKEKPSVLKRIGYMSSKRATNFLLSTLSDGSVGEKQNWLIDNEKKIHKLSGSNDIIKTGELKKHVQSKSPGDLIFINQKGYQNVVIRKEKNFNALLPTCHSCAVQDVFRIENSSMSRKFGFPIGTCIIYEFSIEHVDVNSRHFNIHKHLNNYKPKVCAVTHYVHDVYDNHFYNDKTESLHGTHNYHESNSTKKKSGAADSFKLLIKEKTTPNTEKEILVTAWAIEPPTASSSKDCCVNNDQDYPTCKVTLLSQTVFGGKKLPFWIECEVLKHHPVFDELLKDKNGAKSIYVRKSISEGSEEETINEINLSNFEIMAVLGRGGYGKVLQVKLSSERVGNGKTEEERIFAMKAIKREAVSDGDSKQRLILERLILTELHHPFITSLEYAFHTTTKLYMVMEFVAGGDLFTHIHAVKGFTEERILDHASEMALGIEALHENRVIYRDLKPENVLLDHKGHIKLVDFGLSYRAEPNFDLRTKSFCGTEKYMAPEQLLNRLYGVAIDWWSFGIVLAEMLSGGKHPFAGRNRLETCRNMVTKKQLYVRRLKGAPPVSKELISLMNGFLEKKEGDRLGFGSKGFLRIKKMPFFSDENGDPLNWNDVSECRRKLVFVPDVVGANDLKYFDDVFTDEKPVDSHVPGSEKSISGKSWFNGVWPFGSSSKNKQTEKDKKDGKSDFEYAFDYSPKAKSSNTETTANLN